jgi:hypothetical protein
VVSLLTDLSSEMIYQLLPVFLASVLGAGAVALGVIEGVAESTAALLKVASGAWTARTRRRKPLVVAGYSFSAAVRPLIGLAAAWPAVLAFRFADRVGKGLHPDAHRARPCQRRSDKTGTLTIGGVARAMKRNSPLRSAARPTSVRS